MRALAVGTALLGTLLAGSRAVACSAGGCLAAKVAPRSSVPANLPAIAYFAGVNFSSSQTPLDLGALNDGGVLLTKSDGGQVEITVSLEPAGTPVWAYLPNLASSSFLIVPTAPLVADEDYRVTAPTGCTTTVSSSFHTSAAAPLPTRAGVVSLAPRRGTFTTTTACGLCFASIQAAGVDVSFTPSAELKPFLEVANVWVNVDGKVWPVLPYLPPYGPPVDGGQSYAFEVFGRCKVPTPDYEFSGLAMGHHVGDVRVRLAGTTQELPPVSFNFDLSCDGPELTGPDGCGHGAGGGSGGSGATGGGAGTSGGAAGKTGCGCDASGSIGFGLLLTVLAARRALVARSLKQK